MADDCVFCEIVAGKSPAHPVRAKQRAPAVPGILSWAAGHTLILSKRHVPFWHQLSRAEAADVFALARRVGRRLAKAFDPEFVCLMARGRRIPHTHIFLVPTRPGDVLDRQFNGMEKIQTGSEKLAYLRPHSARAKAATQIH